MTILHALAGYYDRLVSNGEAPDYGYSREGVSYAIVLSPKGEVVNVMDLRDMSGRTPRPSPRSVPRPVPRTSAVASNFLWDKTAYALGVKLDRDTKQPIPADREHAAFKALHKGLLEDPVDDGLKALRTFLDQWQAENFARLYHADDMLDANIVFQLDGERRFLHQRPAARSVWRNHMAGQDHTTGLCLVSGEHAPIERLHPKIKGVRGAQSSGASIVSFNLDAFASFGKDQGANAPVSERAAFAYTTALNTLLARNSGRRIQIGDATTVFWAEAAGDEAGATAAEDLFSMIADPPPTDAEEAVNVADKLLKIAEGQPLAVVEPEVNQDTRFYVLGLAPNAARLSVRFWYEDSIGAIARRIGDHWRDLRLDPAPWRTPPAAWRLLYETAAQRKADNIPPTLGGALMRAILTGGRYPQSLLAAIIMRLRADGTVSGTRAAIVKACIRRTERLSNAEVNKEDYLVSLDSNSDNIAYNLGRLFSAYTYAEKSFADRNATIRDKYMGAASATPRRVFPLLMRGYEHNRAGLAKRDGQKQGAGVRADKAVGQIIERLPGRDELPAALPLEDQARFFVGYYHQERAFYAKSDSGVDQDQPVESEERQ